MAAPASRPPKSSKHEAAVHSTWLIMLFWHFCPCYTSWIHAAIVAAIPAVNSRHYVSGFNFLIRLDRLIAARLSKFVDGTTITCSNILESLHDWCLNLQSRYTTDIVYFNFKKAFDSVSHPKLLVKLKAYGITGNLYTWIAEFLHNRSQSVKLGGSFSSSIYSRYKWCTAR